MGTRHHSTPPGPFLRGAATVGRLGERAFRGDRPLTSLLRLYLAANALALTLALLLEGPAGGQAHGAAEAVLAWCRIA